MQCTVPALTRKDGGEFNLALVESQMGGQNCHVDIEFEDGTIWLARFRLDHPMHPPRQIQSYIFSGEIATLRFLENTSVPAPKVFAYAVLSNTNPVGTSYVLMEKLPGNVLDWDEATSEQRTKVVVQLAEIFLELEKHPFSATGSLLLSHDVPTISGFAQSVLFSSPDQTLGPFETLEDSLRAIVCQQQDQIMNGELSSMAVDNYLSHCWRHDMITRVAHHCHESGPGFFLKHFDDKGDHILVDAEFNITGIIDWEFASAEPKALAFSTPCMLWPLRDFCEGKNDLCAEEIKFAEIFEARGRKDLAKVVRESRKMQRFTFFLGGVPHNQQAFDAYFMGLRNAWSSESEQPSSYEDWKKAAEKENTGDKRLQSLLQRTSRRT